MLAPVLNQFDLNLGSSTMPSKSPAQPAVNQSRRPLSSLRSGAVPIDPAQIGPRWLLELSAHDLRNPISGVLAGTEYLMEDASQLLEPHHLIVLSAIQSSARLALELLHNLNEIATISMAEPKLGLQAADLVDLVQHAVSSLRSQAESMKVSVSLKIKDQPGALRADPGRLGEALRTLAAHVVASSPAGSAIEIEVAGRDREATVVFRRNGAASSSNPLGGTPTAARPKAARRKLADIHTALVLEQADRVVRAHGGTIRARTHRTRGYVLTVTLPVPAAGGLTSAAGRTV
jgi:signal transduction histidine kinase